MKKIIIALDIPNSAKNLKIISQTNDLVWGYKFNNVSISKEGNISLFKYIKQVYDTNLFLDLKLYDIPTTIIKSVMEFHKHVDMITVHCSNGPQALKQLMNEKPQCTIIGVTVLSSFDVLEAYKVYGLGLSDAFEHMVDIAFESHLRAVIVPPNLLELMDKIDNTRDIERIVPGIRTFGSSINEHFRPFTPKMAFDAGADYIIIGRTITESSEPRKILESIIREINEDLSSTL